jgi:LPS export ABC transporter protein LptC
MKQQKSGSRIVSLLKSVGIAALFSGAAILFSACENNLEQIKAFGSSENLPVQEVKNFESLVTDSGKVRFFLKAPKLLRYDNEGNAYIEFPEGMELIKYDENRNIIFSITANYAKQFEKEKKWEAKNNVIATNANGDTLKTEHLFFEEKEEKIYTEEFVKIIRTDQIITGIGFQSDQSMQNWRIKDPKGTIYVNENHPQPDSVMSEEEIKNIPEQPFKNPIEF